MSDEKEDLNESDDRTGDIRAAIASLSDDKPAEAAEPVEAAPTEAAPVAEAAAAEPAEKAAEAPVRAADGKFAPKTAPVDAKTAPVVAPTEVAAVLAAPRSWKPAAREEWSKLKPETQAYLVRREHEVEVSLSKGTADRQMADTYRTAIAPYEHIFRAEGMSGQQVVASLAQTAYKLRTASMPDRAAIIAAVIKQHGIPVEALAAALDGQPVSPQAQQYDPQALIAQARAAMREEVEQERQQSARSSATTELTQFSTGREFFGEVREDMADLLTSASRRGLTLSLSDAYDKACKLDPEISKILDQRAAKTKAATAQAATQRAKAASASVKSAPGGGVQKIDPDDRRSAIRAAMAAAAQR